MKRLPFVRRMTSPTDGPLSSSYHARRVLWWSHVTDAVSVEEPSVCSDPLRSDSLQVCERKQKLHKTRLFVQNYRFHESDRAPTPYRIELEVNGQIQHFSGVISGKGETGPSSDIQIAEFVYDPSERPGESRQSASENPLYANYQDDVIIRQWAGIISPEHILRIEDPKSIIDVMLGALALVGGQRSLDGYLHDMRERGQQDLRQDQALSTLGQLASSLSMARSQVSGRIPLVPQPGSTTSRSRRF